nr:hypothetical protein [Aurantimonas endophytica]
MTVCAGLAVTACAKRPDAILPVEVPMAAYSNLSCEALSQEYLREQSALAAVSQQQNQAATGDAVGVFLLGVPVSSTFGGDKEGQVAVNKGKVNAIDANLRAKGCRSPSAVAAG